MNINILTTNEDVPLKKPKIICHLMAKKHVQLQFHETHSRSFHSQVCLNSIQQIVRRTYNICPLKSHSARQSKAIYVKN